MKLKKKFIVFPVALILTVAATVSAFAQTRYFEDGYYYSFVNNDNLALVGWDYRTSVLPVPDNLNSRPVTSIENNAFSEDENLTGIDFTNATNLHAIGLYSFYNCTNISEKIVFPENVYSIGDCAFQGCTSVPEVEFQADLYCIPMQCFYDCTSLEKVTLNDGLEQILNYAFAKCPALTEVTIPASVTYIAESAFQDDEGLTLGVYYDSYGYTYAREHNIPFVVLEKFLLGDVDGVDGVNINDVTAIQSHLAELKTVEGVYLLAADANQDDVVDISDATAIQMKLAEYELPYPIGQYVTKEIVTQENN